MRLDDILTRAARVTPAATALVHDGRGTDFATLSSRVRATASLLADHITPGDRVLVVADNHTDVVTLLYAAPLAGAVLTPANTRHTPEEVADLADAVAPALVVGSPGQLDRLMPHLGRLGAAVWSLGGAHPAGEDLTARLDALGAAGASTGPVATGRPPAPSDTAWLIHTSGTTGRAKGVELTHANLLAAVLNTAVGRPLRDDDVYLYPFPLFHVAAYNVLHAHLRRRPVVLVDRFDADRVLHLVAQERVTTCSLAPTMLAMLLDHPAADRRTLGSLRGISYGAAAMPVELLRRTAHELPDCGLAQGYGMTELGGNAVFLGAEEHRRALAGEEHLLAAAGRPGPLVEVAVHDDDGAEVPTGATGEIVVRGDQVSVGYWRDPDATAASRPDGWFRTGDLGRTDDDGYLYVVDRRKDLIITGGENVASREVEDVLGAHPDIGSVAVVGRPDPTWGEAVTAVVVPAPGRSVDPAQVREWTRGRMAGFKRPRTIEVRDELPLNASGKVDKAAVRAGGS